MRTVAITVVNTMPLALKLAREGAPGTSAAALAPHDRCDYQAQPGDRLVCWDPVSAVRIGVFSVEEGKTRLDVTSNGLCSTQGVTKAALNIENAAGCYMNLFWIDYQGIERPFGSPVAPGGRPYLETFATHIWTCRSTFTGELLALYIVGTEPSQHLKVARRLPPKPTLSLAGTVTAEPGSQFRFDPLRLIGERRKSTPGPHDAMFLTATVVRQDFSKEVFNGLKNRVLRDVEIAGPLLRWSGSHRVLANYYGEQSADTRSLTIYADRMEVEDRLRFPRANVTIHAREIVFRGIGCIDTTPLPYPTRAQSEYLTQDPLDPTNANLPADEQGDPTYLAADGAKGEPGGNITLHVRQLIDEGGASKRFICRGGAGQQGEAGGLKPYVAKEGYPDKYGPLTPVMAKHVESLFQENNCGRDECWRYRWPGEVDWPGLMSVPGAQGNILNNGHAVSATLLAFCDDIGPTIATPIAWAERGFLPGREYLHWWNPRAAWPFSNFDERAELEGVANPAKRPCDGREAYPGGWPGDGGDGGTVTSALASAPIADSACDLSAGLPGASTTPAPGGAAPGPTPAYSIRIKIVKKSAVASKRTPEVSVTEVTGKSGASARGRRFKGIPAPDGCDEKVSAAKVGGQKNNGKPANLAGNGERLSWAHPAALAAVINHARTAYRNGFRDEAAAVLDPYFAIVSADPAKLAGIDPGLRLAFSSIVSMRNNLRQNLDYYGNPPGWVPRLNALSSLAVLKSVREAAYGTFYFADKMLSDYASLENARAVSQDASKALVTEMDAARVTLQTAYEQLPVAMRALDAVQQEIVPAELEIVRLRNLAVEKNKDKVMVQRFFSAAMQITGGIAKVLPVGQPFLGLAGSALGSIGEFDWNAASPAESAKSSLASLTAHVDTFVADKDGKVAAAVTSGLRGSTTQGEALVTRLTRQMEDEEKEPAAKADAAEGAWTKFVGDERARLVTQIAETNNAISAIRQRAAGISSEAAAADPDKAAEKVKADNEAATGDSFVAQLNRQKAALDDKRIVTLRKGLVEYRKQQEDLETRARLAAKVSDAKLKNAAKRTAGSDIPPTVKEQLTAATRASEDQTALVAARKDTAATVMSSLEGMGSGLSMIGNAIISLTSPLTEDDPTVMRLTEQMLVEDPEMRVAARELNRKLMAILKRKQKATAELVYWHQKTSMSAATVTSNLAALTELSRQRQSLDQGLDPAVQGYLKETRERAKDALAESIYWFVKSYQYEFLSDVDDSFYNFDSWSEKLRALETTKQGAILGREDFERVGDDIFKAEQLKLGKMLLTRRQQRGKTFVGKYESCVLDRQANPGTDQQVRASQMLDSLASGQVSFNFIRDFGKGSFLWNDARVISVELTELDLETVDRNLSLTIRIEQSGDSIIGLNMPDEGRVFYAFRPGRHADPVSWQFVYNHVAKKTNSGLTASTTEDPIADNVKALINSALPDFQEYNPSLLSDYTIRITDLFDGNGNKKDLKSINRVAMRVTLSSG